MTDLIWTTTDGILLLMNKEEELLRVDMNGGNDVFPFLLGGEIYAVHRKGFWNPVFTVCRKDKKILTLTHSFWGSGGRIVFEDGDEYQSAFENKPLVRLRILSDAREVLAYGIVFKDQRPDISFQAHSVLIDAEKVLILSVLGMCMFWPLFREMRAV